ncbi:MAG: CPBP family intramembrane metalloprotease [Lachnospiraceae bacterium]|nr:CPBP family intramembrane metalloprotease [Lachnospiraceae bacterium]
MLNKGNWTIRIWRILAPLLWYFAALTAGSALLPQADASLQVLVSALICLPLLIFWYVRDHRRAQDLDGMGAEDAGNTGRKGPKGPALHRWAAYGVLCLIAGAALSALSAFLMRRLGIYERFSNETQISYQTSAAVWMILGPGLFGPVCEELVYRGLAYQRLCREIPAAAAAVASSLVFAAGHGNMIQFLYAFPMGLLLCAVSGKKRGGQNVFLPVMMHLGANLFSVAATLLRVKGM